MNHVAMVGRLTKDPELKNLSEGRVQTSFVLAVNRRFKHDRETDADFVLCTVWGKSAVNTVKYCGKGSLVSISGRLQSRSYEKEGNRVYVTEVVSEDLRFLATKPPANKTFMGHAKENGMAGADTDDEPTPHPVSGQEGGGSYSDSHMDHQTARTQTLPQGLEFAHNEKRAFPIQP